MLINAQRNNQTWIEELKSSGQTREDAVSDLRQIIKGGLPYALSKWLSPDDPGFEALIEETTQDTLVRVLDKIDTFQGKSKFTTWVYKIAVRIALSELRRMRWRDVSLDELIEESDPRGVAKITADKAPDPDLTTEQRDLLDRIWQILEQELTEKQSQALIAIALQGIPLEELAIKMNTERNALYKLLHDARLRLKKRLAEQDLTPAEILAAFE